MEDRIELWGLQIPHNSVRPSLVMNEDGVESAQAPAAAPADEPNKDNVITWSSVDRLNMSIGLLYALCNHAMDSGVR